MLFHGCLVATRYLRNADLGASCDQDRHTRPGPGLGNLTRIALLPLLSPRHKKGDQTTLRKVLQVWGPPMGKVQSVCSTGLSLGDTALLRRGPGPNCCLEK